MSKIYTPLGASNHCKDEREKDDFYATDPVAIDKLFEKEQFHYHIWEPACGMGHLSKRMIELGHDVLSTELVDRGYGITGVNFFDCKECFDGDIITNPPYSKGLDFVKKALDCIKPGRKVAMFLKLLFLEGKSRREFYEDNPPARIYVFSSRITCAKNGDFEAIKENGGSAVCYAWFVWEKGFKGKPVIDWI
ncbi:hypothetical protein [Parabacteroides sp. AM08-6]|uniref:hypothetical protein n=1 Tax=Parabacteroides sp. AM08-6 TaxID=2292053 RepID=UPI000EFEBDFE|nr:hypothetical protein [Parabacteroides sp. AM08-6]RHJ83511.1 hypothetical protein DW103_07240 [Parabacteroides sp. AM08-6]